MDSQQVLIVTQIVEVLARFQIAWPPHSYPFVYTGRGIYECILNELY
jgi:hypothetical protein